MYAALSPTTIGVRTNGLQEALEAARTGGFEGVEINPREIAGLVTARGHAYVRDMLAGAELRAAAWALPTAWRGGQSEFEESLGELPELARAAAEIGCPRVYTWVLPGSDERPFEDNYRFHVERLAPIARILADHGCLLGLEFVGTKTMRDGMRHEFVHTMGGMLAMAADAGPNAGLLLDCWHWYTSGGTRDEILALRPEQVVYVHVNDAPAGVPVNAQLDNVRALPGETGVIDIVGFLRALRTIGYDGPVTPEPFKNELADLPSDEARLRAVGAAMDNVFRRAGLREE
jgi:sugar phosphate isomerase/epimerase